MDPEHTVNATQGAITRTNRCIFGFTASSSSIQRKMTARSRGLVQNAKKKKEQPWGRQVEDSEPGK
jgi:hypothetical protein